MKLPLSRFACGLLVAGGFFLQAEVLVSRESARPDTGAAGEPVATKDGTAKSDVRDSELNKANYVLQPGDVLRVQVLREEEINKLGEVQVSQEFTVVLPLIGVVDLRGKTVRESQTIIRQLYDRDYLVNPHVNVSVVRYVERFVKIFGQVANPGLVNFRPEEGLTLSEAISRAGGFTRLADQKRLVVTRTFADGRAEGTTVNAADILKGGPGDMPLEPGDIINVPERFF